MAVFNGEQSLPIDVDRRIAEEADLRFLRRIATRPADAIA
jgi:ribose 1,5-bisphosphokinase PhnN